MLLFSDIGLGAFVIIGVATFLAIANKIPIAAIVIALEMTQVDWHFIAPMIVCISVARLMQYYLIPRHRGA